VLGPEGRSVIVCVPKGAAMTAYHCEYAWLGGPTAVPAVLVETVDDRITSVTPGVHPCPGDAEHLSGLTMPGLANTHSHAFHRALRGRTQTAAGSFWTWRERMYALADRLTPEGYHRLARATFGEMALAGVTAVGEFHYLHHGPGGTRYADPNAMGEALIAAAADAGVRITLLDTCYLAGGIGVPPEGPQRRFSDGDPSAWAERASDRDRFAGPTVRLGAAVHSVRALAPDEMTAVAEWADARGAPIHAHVSEQPAENEDCLAAYGCTPTELLADLGVLSDRFTAVHGVHTTDADHTLLGDSGGTACLCPTTERDLADGIAPARSLRDAGVLLALGSDSHAVVDLFEEARAVELDERLATGERGHHRSDALLAAMTRDGHAALGWPEAGRIAAGAPADLCTVRLDSVRSAGATAGGVLDTVVFAATAADVTHVVVGGSVVVRDGAHTRIDVAAELVRELAG
jgi:formiminoglutamate deiminase